MILAFDDFELDAQRYELRRGDKLVKVDALVLRLLLVLLRNAGQLVTKDKLIEEVWEGRAVADNVITVSMARLRKTLQHRRGEHEFIATAYGRGYRFVRPVEVRSVKEPTLPRLDEPAAGGPPFVGRERVLSTLRDAMQHAMAGRGRVCALIGEPGIGKTYVVEALERELPRTLVRTAWGFCREAGDTPPLWPWLRLIREVTTTARTLDWDLSRDRVISDLDGLTKSLDLYNTSLPTLVRNMALENAQRHRLCDAISRFFALAAEQVPWLLVLEDLHRADIASLELLRHLLDEIGQAQLLVVVTLRPTEARFAARTNNLLPQLLAHRHCERVVLERLREQDVTTYCTSMFGMLDERLAKAVYTKSEGNAFFMAELARQLLASGQADPDSVTLPDVSLDLVRQHVASLDPETRNVLSAAAVIGRSFELPLLRAITKRDSSSLMACVDEAIAADVVIAAPDSMTGFAFGHELLRTVLYDALAPTERRRWHLRIAEALEARRGIGDVSPPSELAYHFHAALPESDLRKTVHFCRLAAGAAALAFSNAEVVRYTRHALEALELFDKPSVRLRMHLLFVASMFARGHSAAEFTRATQELVALAREHHDGMMLARGAAMLNMHPGLQAMPGAAAALERALRLLPASNLSMRAVALASLATAAPNSFDERSYELVGEAVSCARAGLSRTARYVSLLAELYLHGGPRHTERAEALAAELDLLAHENPSRMPVLPVDLAFYRAISSLQRGDLEAVSAALDRGTARSRELSHAELLWHCARFRALSRINEGALADGAAQLEALHRQAERRGFFGTLTFCAFDRAVVLGELMGAPNVDESLSHTLVSDPSDPPSIWSLKLRAVAALNLRDEARALLHRVATPSDLARLPCDTHYLGTLGQVAYAALRLNEREYAEVTYRLLEPYAKHFSAHISFLCEGSVAQMLGTLARALGRPGQAIAHLEEGIRANERVGFLPRATQARLELARCLLERGVSDDRDRAIALAREADTAARRLGMRQLARETSVFLSRESSAPALQATSTHAL